MRRNSISIYSYQMVNLLAAIVIISVIAFSALFDSQGDYLVECVHVSSMGSECSTCGLTRSFSEMTRGEFHSASLYNRNGPLLFVFFVTQLVLRAFAAITLINIRQGKKAPPFNTLVYSDSTVSLLLFLVCFRHLLVFW